MTSSFSSDALLSLEADNVRAHLRPGLLSQREKGLHRWTAMSSVRRSRNEHAGVRWGLRGLIINGLLDARHLPDAESGNRTRPRGLGLVVFEDLAILRHFPSGKRSKAHVSSCPPLCRWSQARKCKTEGLTEFHSEWKYCPSNTIFAGASDGSAGANFIHLCDLTFSFRSGGQKHDGVVTKCHPRPSPRCREK